MESYLHRFEKSQIPLADGESVLEHFTERWCAVTRESSEGCERQE